MAIGGAFLKLSATFLYALEFCCAAIILGIYSYFLSVLDDRNINIPRWEQAVTGLSGGTVLYTIFAIVFTCCLGGKTFFALLGLIFNVLCCGAMIAVAVLTRNGAHSCSGIVNTPLGTGPSNSKQGFNSNGQGRQWTYAASYGTTCNLNKACFAVAIIGAVLFLISIPVQILLSRHHKKEKRFGPSPTNNYTRGSGKFWQRNKRSTGLRDPEVATATTVPGATLTPGARDYRPSHDTAYTGSTVGAPHTGYESNLNKPVQGGYHSPPAGTYGATHGATPATNY